MPDLNATISHLQIIHTWADYALSEGANFFNDGHFTNIKEWTEEAILTLKEQDTKLQNTRIRLLPCTCGSKRREHWCTMDGVYLKCQRCGKKAPVGKWETDAKYNWNAMIESEMKSGEANA